MSWSAIKSLFGVASSGVSGWLYAVAGVVLAGLLAWGGHALHAAGANSVQVKWDAEKYADAEAQLARIGKSDAIGAEIGNGVALKLEGIHVQVVTLMREIPKHVTPEIDARYPLPVGLERVWNASALGIELSGIPLATGQSDDSPSGAKASDAAARIAEDNGNHRACVTTLQGLVDWVMRQHELGAAR